MDQLFVRELINASWAALALGLVVVFGFYLVPEMRVAGWYREGRNKAAVALIIYFLGEAIGRSWTVSLLWSARVGYHPDAVAAAYQMAVMGFLVAMAGGLCCIRVFSRESWGNWSWLLTLLGCSIAAGITGSFG